MPSILVESFAGIGGARRALQLLGVTPALHIHIESDPAANKVVAAMFPDAICLGDITEVTTDMLRESARGTTVARYVLHSSGTPCQNVSGLNACKVVVHGSKSKLVGLLGPRRPSLL